MSKSKSKRVAVAEVVNVMKVLNIATPSGKEAWEAIRGQSNQPKTKNIPVFDAYAKRCDIVAFLKTLDYPPLKIDSDFIFAVPNGGTALMHGKEVKFNESTDLDDRIDEQTFKWDDTAGVMAPAPQRLRDKMLAIIVCDADLAENSNQVLAMMAGEEFCPSISYNCMSRFYDGNPQTVVNMLAKGTLVVIDFIPDQKIELTDAQSKALTIYNREVKKKHGNPKPLKPPKPGYTLVDRKWHRAATVVLQDTKTKKCFLLGRDGDTYFGCELPEAVQTVEAAHECPQPEAVKGRSDWDRHGEWFTLPVATKDVPEEKDCIAISNIETDYNDGQLWLPRNDPMGAKHFFGGTEIRFSKDGKFYVLGLEITHERGDHEDLKTQDGKWRTLHCNRAVRSFSQEGVD